MSVLLNVFAPFLLCKYFFFAMAELSRFVSMECSHVYSQFCDEIGNRQEGDKRLSEFLAEGGNKQEINRMLLITIF